MEFFINTIIVSLAAFSLFMIFRPKPLPKSKEQKQEELRETYRRRLLRALENIDDTHERQAKKIALLKQFAQELRRNLFFDEEEVKRLIAELAEF